MKNLVVVLSVLVMIFGMAVSAGAKDAADDLGISAESVIDAWAGIGISFGELGVRTFRRDIENVLLTDKRSDGFQTTIAIDPVSRKPSAILVSYDLKAGGSFAAVSNIDGRIAEVCKLIEAESEYEKAREYLGIGGVLFALEPKHETYIAGSHMYTVDVTSDSVSIMLSVLNLKDTRNADNRMGEDQLRGFAERVAVKIGDDLKIGFWRGYDDNVSIIFSEDRKTSLSIHSIKNEAKSVEYCRTLEESAYFYSSAKFAGVRYESFVMVPGEETDTVAYAKYTSAFLETCAEIFE